MKKRIIFALLLAFVLSCVLAFSVSAAPVVYDNAPARTNIEINASDIVVFDDGFTTLSAYIVKDDKTFGWKANAYDFTFINEQTGKQYTYDNIVELDVPQGVTTISTSAFASNKTIVRASFPDSVETLGGTIFEYCSNLSKFTFEHTETSKLKTIPNWLFSQCTSLIAISFPDCVEEFTGSAHLGGCTNLTAIYLPKNLKKTEGGQNANATFGHLKNGYFVNEPFTYDNIPQKPDVYYFPANYNSMTGEAFDTCKNLNKVLVFPANGITFENAWTFENAMSDATTKPTIVFTGDVTKVDVGSWNVNAVYFANENDIDKETAGVSGSKTIYYCHAAGNTHHLFEKTLSTDADCENPAMMADYCFCGTIMGTPIVDENSSPLGHNHNGAVVVTYENGFYMVGLKTTACTNKGCDHLKEESILPIFVSVGYSHSEEATGKYAIMQGFAVNYSSLEAYNGANENAQISEYGLLAGSKANLDLVGGEIFDANGEVAETTKVAYRSFADTSYVLFEMKISGLEKTKEVEGETIVYADLEVYNCAYYLVKNVDAEDNVTYTSMYMDANGITETLTNAVTYNGLANKAVTE